MKKKQKFEQYLADRFWEQYEGLDDESVDAEEQWLAELSIDEVIGWANEWAKGL